MGGEELKEHAELELSDEEEHDTKTERALDL
eukprot:CAMPEP_0182592146 /NCGR_PEP_ID=MMETSP1324-20130603/75335_1 /TAXON_ID=236786 /ORGANISM="Florenciella sp., Strain RCC1587" /LENGTH=30 /DNA_ID= /DNA_START= /DNA_END= /DNA_ORIENTATION=